eukprot:5025612-Prymnesium_polylepis.1
MFDAADEAGGTLTAQIYEDHPYDGVPVLRQAQKRYRARCAARLQLRRRRPMRPPPRRRSGGSRCRRSPLERA